MSEGRRVCELNNQIRFLQIKVKNLVDYIQEGRPCDIKGRKEWDNKSLELNQLEDCIEKLYEEKDSYLDLL